jgi:DNA-binding NarL/FixJ family response regulator
MTPLEKVAQLDQELKFVRTRWENAVWEAQQAGMSLRQIAAQTDVSVETVRTACKKVSLRER